MIFTCSTVLKDNQLSSMKFISTKYIPHLYLFVLTAGALFFIPAVFVNRFTTASSLWLQGGISIGVIGYVLLTKGRIALPSKTFIFLLSIWAIYHTWQRWGNIESKTTIITLTAAFFLFYAIWTQLENKQIVFAVFASIGLALSLLGLGQFTGLLPSYHSSFSITGPFDNPAGISASLVILLPFSLYCCRYSIKRRRLLTIIATCLIISVIILSKARTAIFATTIILILFFIYLLKERDVRFSFAYYSAIFAGCLLLLVGLFFMKKDSANGRLLIWKCSTQLISQKPILGYGGSGFTANYMNEQAAYFTRYPDSKYANLADNVRESFNEFLKWTVNYGIVGLSLTLLLINVPIWTSRKQKMTELFFIRLSILAIGICAFFSYPFNYPFIQLMGVALLAFLLAQGESQQASTINNIWIKGALSLFSLGLLTVTAYQAHLEREWHIIAHKSLRGETHQMLPLYKSLYTHLRYNDLFLYNYAAELNVAGYHDESMKVATECNKLWADYDLQMLMADNCLKLQQYCATESYLKKAAAMCPVKFMPLYRLTELYLETGRKDDAHVLAHKILNKKVKIHSALISSIKNKMQKLLNEAESWDDTPHPTK